MAKGKKITIPEINIISADGRNKGAQRPRRVKLLDLPDSAQAVAHTRDEEYLQINVYGYDSENKPVQFVAPFAFSGSEARDKAFADDVKLADFAKAVFVTQMANIDPNLDTKNFQTT